jgi:hypothetical protein
LLAETRTLSPLLGRAWLLAMLDRCEEARQAAHEASERHHEQSDTCWADW